MNRTRPDTRFNRYKDYRFRPFDYIKRFLNWEPWNGDDDEPGQVQICDAYALALRQQIERQSLENGEITEDQLTVWHPGQTIKNWIKIPAGYTVGKTTIAAGLANHFFDTCTPALIEAFAPSFPQAHDLLMKEVKAQRGNKGLPGRILNMELRGSPIHFLKAKVAGTREGIQGQHGPFLMFILDEAEGIPTYYWEAVETMVSGGIAIVLMLGNPRTRVSDFHKASARPDCVTLRISELWHPNVKQGREVVPGSVRRDHVNYQIEDNCQVVSEHSADDLTFSVPWDVRLTKNPDVVYPAGTIYKPNTDFMFEVMGIAPIVSSDKTVIPVGRYEAAVDRYKELQEGKISRRDMYVRWTPEEARLGLDAAHMGRDQSTLYCFNGGLVQRLDAFSGDDFYDQARKIKLHILALAKVGVKRVQLRVDAGGGYGTAISDPLRHDLELIQALEQFVIIEVHFGGEPHDPWKYADRATELYFEAAESLKGVILVNPPTRLEADLTEREFGWVNSKGVQVRLIEPKDKFRKRIDRSPDDGDGFILAVAPDSVFLTDQVEVFTYENRSAISPY